MPVVKLYLDRFARMVGAESGRIVDRLPYLGLDIEGEDKEEGSVRVEYNPNRPDFSTDYGIARAMRGLLGIETGLPRYGVVKSGITVQVRRNIAGVRPFIACAAAVGLRLDDETIRQLISMQEDLHNGLGRRRRKVSIGLHNLDAIRPPIYYEGVGSSFSFVPLGERSAMTVADVLTKTETGRAYGQILKGPTYPILRDSQNTVLSFPPIINGVATRVDTRTRSLFVDVTSTDEEAGMDALAVIASALSDASGRLESVSVKYPGRTVVTPDLSPTRMRLDKALARGIVGLDVPDAQLRSSFRRCRLDVTGAYVSIPRYRSDILHAVDLAEELLIGYGLERLQPAYPPAASPGAYRPENVLLDEASEVMSQSGFLEVMNFDLVEEVALYRSFGRSDAAKIEVEDPRSMDHHLLRDALIPSMMAVLSRNVKETYPQRIFEVGRVYERAPSGIVESQHLAALTAHSSSGYSEAKMYLSALIRTQLGGEDVETEAGEHWAFAAGRCAKVLLRGKEIGYIGEVRPMAISSFGLEVPVSGFELDLSALRR